MLTSSVLLAAVLVRCTSFTAASDTGADAGAAADASAGEAGRWCDGVSPVPKLCEDFDGVLAPVWSFNSSPRASVDVDDAAATSPPNALHAATEDGGTTMQWANLKFSIVETPGTIRVAYDLRVDAFGDYTELGTIRISGANGSHMHVLQLDSLGQLSGLSSSATLSDGGTGHANKPFSSRSAVGTWVRVSVALDLVTAHTISASVDGLLRATYALDPNLFAPGNTVIELGVSFFQSDAGSATAVRIDNVTVDWN
jgi:hypothetical protein